MKKSLLLFLLTLGVLLAKSQNPDGNRFVFQTLSEALQTKMALGQKITVDEKGVGGEFVVTSMFGLTADTALVFLKPDGTGLKRIVPQAGAISSGWFGLVGDGVTNNYAAYQRLIRYITVRGGGLTLTFEPGVYFIDSFKVTGGTKQNNISDLEFINCNNLKIVGYGAVISVNGHFRRTADYRSGSFNYSFVQAITPMKFSNCKNIWIEGFELNGNVGQMTEDAGMAEGNGNGILLQGCNNVNVKNIYAHHLSNDGMYINGYGVPMKASKNITVENFRSYYNGRQGTTVSQAYNVTFNNCEFNSTADSLGSYAPGHAPRYGVDVEPNQIPPVVDVMTSNIYFNNCQFKDNQGATISVTGQAKDVFVNGGILDNTLHNFPYALIAACNNFVLENATFYTGTGKLYPTFGTGAGQKTLIRHNQIYTKSSGIMLATAAEFGVVIDDNTITGQHDSAFNSYFPYIVVPSTFKNNTITYPSKAYGISNEGLIQSSNVSNNRFLTDLDTANGKVLLMDFSNSQVWQNNIFPVSGAIRPTGVSNSFSTVVSSAVGSMYNTETHLLLNPSPSQAGKFDLNGGGNRLSNYISNTDPGTPPHTSLSLVNRFAAGYMNNLSISSDSKTSGMNFSSQDAGFGTIVTGGYQTDVLNYMAQETSLQAFQVAPGIFKFSGANATPGTTVTPTAWGLLNSVGLSLNGASPTAGLNLKANSANNPNIVFDLAGAVPKSVFVRGAFQALPRAVTYTDTTGTTDTLATMRVVRAATPAPYTQGYGLTLASNQFSVDSTKFVPNRNTQTFAGIGVNSLYVRPSSSATISKFYVQDTLLTKALYLYNGLQGGNPTISNSRNNRAFDFNYVGGTFGLIGSGSFDYTLPSKTGTLAMAGDLIPYTSGGTGLTALGGAGQALRVNTTGTGYEFYTPSQTLVPYTLGGTGLTALGGAGQALRVNSTRDGYEFYTPYTQSLVPVSLGGTGLTNVGSVGQFLRVNPAGNGYEFYTLPPPGVTPYTLGGTGLISLGATGQSIRVNSAGNGYEFYTPLTGIVPYSSGGTGLSTIGSTGQVLRVNSTGNGYEFYTPSQGLVPYTLGGTGLTSLGGAGQALRVNSTGTGYEFYTPSSGSGSVQTVNGISPDGNGNITIPQCDGTVPPGIPTVSSLGVGVSSATISGDNGHFELTLVTSGQVLGTVCFINFGGTWVQRPVVVQSLGNFSAVSAAVIGARATSNTNITVTGNISQAGTYYIEFICR